MFVCNTFARLTPSLVSFKNRLKLIKHLILQQLLLFCVLCPVCFSLCVFCLGQASISIQLLSSSLASVFLLCNALKCSYKLKFKKIPKQCRACSGSAHNALHLLLAILSFAVPLIAWMALGLLIIISSKSIVKLLVSLETMLSKYQLLSYWCYTIESYKLKKLFFRGRYYITHQMTQ